MKQRMSFEDASALTGAKYQRADRNRCKEREREREREASKANRYFYVSHIGETMPSPVSRLAKQRDVYRIAFQPPSRLFTENASHSSRRSNTCTRSLRRISSRNESRADHGFRTANAMSFIKLAGINKSINGTIQHARCECIWAASRDPRLDKKDHLIASSSRLRFKRDSADRLATLIKNRRVRLYRETISITHLAIAHAHVGARSFKSKSIDTD